MQTPVKQADKIFKRNIRKVKKIKLEVTYIPPRKSNSQVTQKQKINLIIKTIIESSRRNKDNCVPAQESRAVISL